MKDYFSLQSDNYARYRPTYPPEIFKYIYANVPSTRNAWDCATGNGQIASRLAKVFKRVYASDISPQQISNAIQADNIFYSVQPAEKTNFVNDVFDLIVSAQAVHWFDFECFYSEVLRTAKNNALLCLIGYGRLEINRQINDVIADFYHNVIGMYWDKERSFIEARYTTIPFPFKEIHSPDFVIVKQWTLEHLYGYLNTWSAVKHFTRHHNFNPVDDLMKEIEKRCVTNVLINVRFPLFMRAGRILK